MQLYHIQQIFTSIRQVAAVDFTTLGAGRFGRQVRGSRDLDGSRKEKEEFAFKLQEIQRFTSALFL